MTRKQLILFIFVDLVMMGFAGQGAWSRYQLIRGDLVSSLADETDSVSEPTVGVVSGSSTGLSEVVNPSGLEAEGGEKLKSDVAVAPAPVPTAAPAPAPASVRKIFSYDNSKAKVVQLVGDFNNWNPQEFSRDVKGRWTVSIPLAPGDYSYSFIVDGKTIRDPYQRRTDVKGRSFLTVP